MKLLKQFISISLLNAAGIVMLTVSWGLFTPQETQIQRPGVVIPASPALRPLLSVTHPALRSENSATDDPQPSSPAQPADSRCIIEVNGMRYDVTQFRAIHSGGDIFRCGQDMTQTFYSKHSDTTLEQMKPYRIL